MATGTTKLDMSSRWDDLATSVRRIRHSMTVIDLMLQPDYFRDAEVIAAGIEGRAIVRAGMHEVRRFIGEVP